MQGSPEVLRRLNELLGYELAAMDLYLAQAALLENWGFLRLKERLRHESDDERGHAEKLIARIVFLDGIPKLNDRPQLPLGADPKDMLEKDLAYEHGVARMLNELIAVCGAELDSGTRALLEELLLDTENDHIFWLEAQLELISQLGLPFYLAQQTR